MTAVGVITSVWQLMWIKERLVQTWLMHIKAKQAENGYLVLVFGAFSQELCDTDS